MGGADGLRLQCGQSGDGKAMTDEQYVSDDDLIQPCWGQCGIVALKARIAQLREALETIRDCDDECACDHEDANCCARQPAGVFCARCYAAAALRDSEKAHHMMNDETQCVHVQVPEIACYVRFGPQVLHAKRSTRDLGTTCRGEQMIADLDDMGRICGIELVGGKPCQEATTARPEGA